MSGKNVVESFREVVQDLLVPELKALKVSVEALRSDTKLTTDAIREEMRLSNDALREEMRLSTNALREEMKLTNDALREEMKLRFEILERSLRASDLRTEQLVRALSDKFETSTEMRERLASLEARLPRQ